LYPSTLLPIVGACIWKMIILNTTVHWDNAASDPFIHKSIPITDEGDYTLTLSDFIQNEIISARSNLQYDDTDILSITSSSGAGKRRLLNVAASFFFESIKTESPHGLIVVLDRGAGIVRSFRQPTSLNDKLMAVSRPPFDTFTSNWTLDNVDKFLSGYEQAHSKSGYLSQFWESDKPQLPDQIKTFAIEYLNEHSLGYRPGAGAEKRALDALGLLVRVLTFTQQHHNTLRHERVQLHDGSALLKSIERCVSCKTNQGKEGPLVKGKLIDTIELSNKCMYAWPSSWAKKKDNVETGKPIYDELTIIKYVLRKQLKVLIEQDDRNVKNRVTSISSGPTRFNTEVHIISATIDCLLPVKVPVMSSDTQKLVP